MKLLLHDSSKSVSSPFVDTKLMLKGRNLQDNDFVNYLPLEERDSIDEVVMENRAGDDKKLQVFHFVC